MKEKGIKFELSSEETAERILREHDASVVEADKMSRSSTSE
jgi:hypothetical protein